MIRVATADQTVRTAILEARYIWGDEALLRSRRRPLLEGGGGRQGRRLRQGEARRARRAPQAHGRQPLRRRAQRQGGQRRASRPPRALLDRQICLSAARRSPSWSTSACSRPSSCGSSSAPSASCGRCAAISTCVAGRAEERLTFDYQREIAARMNYADRPGKSPVERFMRHYFLHAKTVGDLTGVFLAHLDEKFAGRGRRMGFPAFRRRPRKLEGFLLDRGRLAIPDEAISSREDPVRLIRMFALADRHGLEIHPLAMRAAARHAKLIDAKVRADPERQRLVPRRADQQARSRDGAALDERGRHIRPLHSRFRPRRRPDAVRHVPSLHGRRAFDPGDRPARRGSSAAS